MKKIFNYLVPGTSFAAIVFAIAAFSSSNAATHPLPVTEPMFPALTDVQAVPVAQPVDLTYAAEKALPSVVHIKNTQNSKIQMSSWRRTSLNSKPLIFRKSYLK